jgi:L-Ala-D/L-Glu epimerase
MSYSPGLKLSFSPYMLELKHRFAVAWGARTTTEAVLTTVEYDGLTGYGEASMPPYLGESVGTVMDFLSRTNLSVFSDPTDVESIIGFLDNIAPGNYAAKASVDIAIHDLAGKLLGRPCYDILGLDPLAAPVTSYTIGIDSPDKVRERVSEAEEYSIIKVKLGGGNDREMIDAIRDITQKPLYIDVNSGWTDKYYALDMICLLKEQGVVLVEQPMPESMEKDIEWLGLRSPLPLFADEGIKTLGDLNRKKGLYSGLNIKLMKCGGMFNAFKMIEIAREAGMKVMMGCMTETSCGISAAAQLSPAVDYADLDGNLLISNDCFDGMKIVGGRVTLSKMPGIGITKKK